MRHLGIATKLMLLVSVFCAFCLVVGGVGLNRMTTADSALDDVYSNNLNPRSNLGEIQNLLLRNRLALTTASLDPTPERITKKAYEVESSLTLIEKPWDEWDDDVGVLENRRERALGYLLQRVLRG